MKFHMLGPFEAYLANGEKIDFSHRKAQALLAYLAVERSRAQPREHLATLLWGRTGEERARHNLRQALSKLRTLCPELVDTQGSAIKLTATACQSDVSEFEDLAGSNDPAELRRALALYRGELLEGYSAREPAYQDWLELARARLHKRACDVAIKLATGLRDESCDTEAIDVLNHLLHFDSANESAHRELMGLLARTGRRTEALRQYQECAAALARELDTEPGAETKQLLATIKQGRLALPGVAQKAATPGPAAGGNESKTSAHNGLAAILVADLAGASLTSDGLQQQMEAIADGINLHHGKVLQRSAATLLAWFVRSIDATNCALALQYTTDDVDEHLQRPGPAPFRIGIHHGDLIEDGVNITSDHVSIATRLAALAVPGGICVSEAIRDATLPDLQAAFTFIGEHQAPNVTQSVRTYRVTVHVDEGSACAEPSTSTPVATLPLPGKPSLIIKPFINMSADAEQDYFAEGLSKDINIALTKIPGLFLAADESPTARVSQGMSVTELGRRFGVRYVLTGGVRRHGARVRVNAELVDSASGQCLWGERFDRELDDLFLIQDEITEEIVTAMDVKLIQGEAARFMRKALTKSAALEASYRGWYALYHGSGKQDVRQAQHLFEEVIRLEPESPLGYASAALAYWAEAGFGRVVVNSPAMEHAAKLARKALELEDTTGYAHLVMALVHLAHHEYEEAMAQATEGVSARPNCNGAYAIKSSVLNYLGRPHEAIEFAQYAVRLTPVYPAEFPAVLAAAYHDSSRHSDAIAAANASLQLRNNDVDPLLILTAANVALGNLDEARGIAARVQDLEPTFCLAEFAQTQPYQNPQDLERLIGRLREAGLPD